MNQTSEEMKEEAKASRAKAKFILEMITNRPNRILGGQFVDLVIECAVQEVQIAFQIAAENCRKEEV